MRIFFFFYFLLYNLLIPNLFLSIRNIYQESFCLSINSALPKFSLMPTNLYLNPILDEKFLDEMYNFEDYYDNYDYAKTNESSGITFPQLENTTREEANFTIIENDNINATTVFIVLENFTETSFIDLNEEANTTFTTGISFNESTIYSDETIEKIDYNNISTTTDIDNVTQISHVNSEREMEENSTTLSTQDNYPHLILTTLNTGIESATNKFAEESVSTEMIDKISTALESSTLDESVIPPLEKDTRHVIKCFEQVCTTTQDAST